MTDTSLVEVTVGDIRVIRQGRVVALASAELTVDGVSFALHGMQVIRTRDATTGKDALGVDLPRYRDPTGAWRPALELPDELRKPLGDAVLERCCELGIAEWRGDDG
jgi:stage V sporulation protein G